MFNLVALILLVRHGTAAATCYDTNSNAVASTDFGLCDPSAEGTAGSQSSCCSIGNGDACLSTGLCLSSWSTGADGLLWVSGCTDPTWQDSSCANFCVGHTDGQTSDVYALLACSNTTWCCSGDWEDRKFIGNKTECCKDTITLPTSGIGSVVRELRSASATGAASTTGTTDCPAASGSGSGSSGNSKTTAAIVGGVLGTALLASLVLAVVLMLSNRQLRRRLQTSQGQGPDTSGGYVPQPLVNNAQGFVPQQPPNKSEMSMTPAPPFGQLAVPPERLELGDNPVRPAELGSSAPGLGNKVQHSPYS